jgi:hypothetical protein
MREYDSILTDNSLFRPLVGLQSKNVQVLRERMNGSEITGSLTSNVWRFAVIVALVLLAGLYVSHKITVMDTAHWVGNEVEVLQADGSWSRGRVTDISTQDFVQGFRFFIEINNDPWWQEPVGLNIAGPFSAELSWDGERVGGKGIVGDSPDSETPGTIDSISLIPPGMLEPGTHRLDIRLSTQSTGFQAARIMHIVSLGPYRVDDRRSLRYYAAPLLLLSGLLILTFQSLRIGFSTGNRLYSGLGIFAGFITVSLVTEVSRALINYSYNFHDIRGFLMWFSIICAGLTLNYICYSVQQHKWVSITLISGFLIFAITGNFGLGGDQQIARNFIFLAATPTFIYLFLLFKNEISFLSVLPLYWAACVLSFKLSFGIFLDAYIFVASLIFLGSAWFWVYVRKPPAPARTGQSHLLIKSKGKEIYVAAKDAIYLKAEGNFTEVLKADGTTLLHQLPIGKIMDSPPDGYIRVHRSYAVNKDYIKSLRSAEGSKYWLELNGAGNIPVSRFRVAEIRSLLSA